MCFFILVYFSLYYFSIFSNFISYLHASSTFNLLINNLEIEINKMVNNKIIILFRFSMSQILLYIFFSFCLGVYV
jgi:hypothetical protein